MRNPMRFFSGSESLRASGSAGLMVVTRVIGTFGTLAYTVMMARMLDPKEFGLVWTLWSAVFIASYLSTLNIGATAIREVTRARALGNEAAAAGFVILSRRVLVSMSGLVMMAFGALIWMRNPEIVAQHPVAVLLAAVMIPVMGWNATNASQAVALDQVLRSQIPAMLLRPLVFVVALGAIWTAGITIGLEVVTGIYLTVVVVIAMVQYALIRPFFGFMKDVTPDITGWQRWISTGLMLAPNRLLTDRLKDVLLLISAVPLGAVGVAQMAVALSVTNFLSFTINAVETSFSPKIARALSQNDAPNGVPQNSPRTTHFLAISGLIKLGMMAGGAVMLWLCMPLIMALFGQGYAQSADLMWWFYLVPLSVAVFGNTSLVMQMFDQRMAFFLTSLLALISLPVMGLFCVPYLVAAGHDPLVVTAACFAVTLIALQAVRWALCCARTGIDVSALGSALRWHRQTQQFSTQHGADA